MTATASGSGITLRKREFFSSLQYEPHPGQVLVHRSKASRRIVACGARFGKSRCAAMETIAALFEPRPGKTIGWTCAPTYGLAKKIFDDVVGTIHEYLPHRIVAFNPRDHQIVIRNFGAGLSELRGKSTDSSVGLLGEGLDFLVVDEAARMSEEIWTRHLSQRLVDKNGWALLISTPRGGGWFYNMFKRGQRGRDPAFESWSAPSWTNPHLDRSIIEEERMRLTDDVFRQEYGGEFVNVDREQCDTCKGPSADVPGMLVVEGYPTIPTCVECQRPVDVNGRTIVTLFPNGQENFTIIHLVKRPADTPPLPAPN